MRLVNSFITTDNGDDLIRDNLVTGEVDLLSIDLDGNDLHILEAISCVTPRAIVMEYNARFLPPIEYCIEYQPQHSWDGTDNYGASLSLLTARLKAKGYSLVACNLCGINSFFVRDDLLGDHFQEPFSAEFHFQPPRHGLTLLSGGHWPSYATLENRVHRTS